MNRARGRSLDEPVCLALVPEPVFGFLHRAELGSPGSVAVLICPPFGWEEQSSYRGLRIWAQTLAKGGYPTLRFSFPGTGDSGGSPADPDRLQAWTQAVSAAAGWLRVRAAASRVTAIGIGFGGVMAVRALAAAAPIDDLALWAVPATGRKLVRELRAHSRIVAARYPIDSDALPELPGDGAEMTGFLLSRETESALQGLDLTQLSIPSHPDRRILMIGRDRVAVDNALRANLAAGGAAVTAATTEDYANLMTEPQEAQAPVATIEATLEWLEGGRTEPGPARPGGAGPMARPTMEIVHHGVRIRETPMFLEVGGRRDFAVLCEPLSVARASTSAVFLGAAALPHSGPNRAWVEAARRWATQGVASIRLDLWGIGDSDGEDRDLVSNDGLYSEERKAEALAVLDHLEADWGWDRLVLVGLCSGAYLSLHAALARRQVVAALMINLYALFWSDALVAERDRRETVAALRNASRARLSRHDLTAGNLRRARRGLVDKLRPAAWHSLEAIQTPEVDRALDQLRDQGTHALMLLSHGEPLYEQFEREGRVGRFASWPNLVVERIPSPDHMFRDLRAQRFVRDQLDRSMTRVLAQAPEPELSRD